MLKIPLAIAALLAFFTTNAQYGEVSFHLKNGILLNSGDVETTLAREPIAILSNTSQHSIGGAYTYVFPSSLLLSGGLDIGYEYYKAFIDYPFEEYGFDRDPLAGKHYQQNKYVPYLQAHINIGYRFTRIGGIIPELRLGQIAHMAMAGRELDFTSLARPSAATRGQNFYMRGAYGGHPATSKIEFINSIYLGAAIPGLLGNVACFNVGIQLQKQLIGRGVHNYFDIYYNDGNGTPKGADFFRGSHTSASLVLGLVLKSDKDIPHTTEEMDEQ